jgi:hypothetical protein
MVGRSAQRLPINRGVADAKNGRSGLWCCVARPGRQTALLDGSAAAVRGMRVVGIEAEASALPRFSCSSRP